jgi:prepilin-type N-terminal cleavage/methylation domain-containing protein
MTYGCIQRRTQAGMTLIEVVVALALMSMLGLGMLSTMRVGQRLSKQVTDSSSWVEQVALSQGLIRRIIETTVPLEAGPDLGLSGTGSKLVALARDLRGAEGAGLRWYEVAIADTAAGRKGLVVRTWPLHDRDGANGGISEVLIDDVESLEFTYTSRGELAATTSSDWKDSRLPAAVTMKLITNLRQSRIWPDLTVAPYPTDSGRCVFDVVAQACRRSAR